MADFLKTLAKAARRARKTRPLAFAATWRQALTLPKPKRPPKPAAKGSSQPLPRPAAGSFITGEFQCRHGARAYKLYTPVGSTRRRMPLVVMLHGCAQTATDFATGTNMNRLADELGFIVLYPQQSQSANLARCWNWHAPEHQLRGRGEPALIAGLTRHVMALARANPSRVYVAGLSAGAGAAAIMGAAYPDIFVAVGIHSGVALGKAHSLGTAMAAMRGRGRAKPAQKMRRPLPMIVFQGDQDRVVHPSNAAEFLANLENSRPGPLISQSFPGKSAKGREFTRKVYRSPAGEVLLEVWTIHGSGHGWSGGHAAGSYTDPAGPEASREMLRFFLARKRGLGLFRPAHSAT